MVRQLDDTYGLASLQNQLLDTLDVLDELCRKHDIRYTLHGGTVLGAERNHHLIPWDDDVDIAMKRSEYLKLRKILKKEEQEGYYLDEETMWFPRFVRKNAEDPVYVDILLWDFISERRAAQLLKITLLRMVQGMMKQDVDYSRFHMGGKILLFVTGAAGKLLTNRQKAAMTNYIGTKLFLGRRQYIHRYNDSFKGCSYILDRGYMNGYTTIELEGRRYMVNRRYKEFLIMEYGEDYMTPPPEKDRTPGHEQFRNTIRKKQESGEVS